MTQGDIGRSREGDLPPPPEDRPRWWHLSLAQLLVAAFWGLFFFLLSRAPLGEPELWGNVAWGKWILTQRVLPREDPLAPLLGMPVIDADWLSQVLLAAAAARGGAEALSLVFAAAVWGAYLILARTFFLQTGSLVAAHGGVVAVAAIGWSRTATARPELFGVLCFALLLWLLVRDRVADARRSPGSAPDRRWRWELWLGIPLLMAVWANLHSSFVCGLLVLACWLCGTIVDVLRDRRSLHAAFADPTVRRWIWLGELALAATCLNPHGAELLLQTVWFADYEQLRELSDWRRLVVLDAGGREWALSLAVLLGVFRWSRRRIPAADVLLVAAFSVLLACGARMAWWYAAVFGVVITPHLPELGGWLRAATARWRRSRSAGLPTSWGDLAERRSWTYTLVALVVLWIALALSPAGTFVGSRNPRSPDQLYSEATPWKLSAFLREQPPSGQLFNPDWWGDWLAWDGPPDVPVFMTANMHLAPRQVWIDYRIVRENRSGWDHVLDRYGVETVVLDKRRQKTMTGYLRSSPTWRVLYEDELGVVFGRVTGGTADAKPNQKA